MTKTPTNANKTAGKSVNNKIKSVLAITPKKTDAKNALNWYGKFIETNTNINWSAKDFAKEVLVFPAVPDSLEVGLDSYFWFGHSHTGVETDEKILLAWKLSE